MGSALGLLIADHRIDHAVTARVRLDGSARSAIQAIFGRLEERAHADANRMGLHGELVVERSASMRYVGQGYEVRVDLPVGSIDISIEQSMRAAFSDRYAREYGYSDADATIEVIDWFVAVKPAHRGDSRRWSIEAEHRKGSAVKGHRLAYFPEAGGMVSSAVVDRYAMATSDRLIGPLLVEERESTTVVLPGDVVTVSRQGNLVVDIGAAQ